MDAKKATMFAAVAMSGASSLIGYGVTRALDSHTRITFGGGVATLLSSVTIEGLAQLTGLTIPEVVQAVAAGGVETLIAMATGANRRGGAYTTFTDAVTTQAFGHSVYAGIQKAKSKNLWGCATPRTGG